MKLVYYLHWDEDPVAPLVERHTDITFVKASSMEDAVREVVDADFLVTNGRFYAGELGTAVKTAPKLRWVQSSSIGFDQFVKKGMPGHISFTNAAGLKGTTVGEHAVALMLAQIHAVPLMEKNRAARQWGRDALHKEVRSVEQRTAVVVGYGSIGSEIARKVKAFDMHVIAVNRAGKGEPPADEFASLGDLDSVLPRADVVLLSLPLSPGTRHLFGPAQFAVMKKSAVLVNVGRGAVIDQAALREALETRQIGGACLDVFEEEPLPADDPLWDAPNIIVSPHVAGAGGQTYARFTELVSGNLDRLKTGEPLLNMVEPEAAVA